MTPNPCGCSVPDCPYHHRRNTRCHLYRAAGCLGPIALFVVVAALMILAAALPTPAHGMDWNRVADRIERVEHPRHATCAACLSGRGHRAAGYVGPYQFSKAWNRAGVGCRHGYRDWRCCRACCRRLFVTRARIWGRSWVRRHWGWTHGGLR